MTTAEALASMASSDEKWRETVATLPNSDLRMLLPLIESQEQRMSQRVRLVRTLLELDKEPTTPGG